MSIRVHGSLPPERAATKATMESTEALKGGSVNRSSLLYFFQSIACGGSCFKYPTARRCNRNKPCISGRAIPFDMFLAACVDETKRSHSAMCVRMSPKSVRVCIWTYECVAGKRNGVLAWARSETREHRTCTNARAFASEYGAMMAFPTLPVALVIPKVYKG